MKKKLMKVLVIVLGIFTLGLSSCAMSRANVYNYWKVSGTEYLSKDHVVEQVSIGDILKKMNSQSKDSNDIFYVFYGNHDSSSAQSAINVYNEQAIQFEIKTLYWLDSNQDTNHKNEIQDKLGVSDASETPALFAFKNGALVFDTTRAYYSNNSSKYSYVKYAQIAFRQLFDENGNYSYEN